MLQQAHIIDAVRLPRARVKENQSAYSQLRPVQMLEPLFQALEQRNSLNSEWVEDVLLGCNTQIDGQGADIAKIAALYAGWADSVSGATVNRFCCSGLDAINMAASKIIGGMESVVVAGGVEQLCQVPMFSDRGDWFSNKKVMFKTRFMHMGVSADLIANMHGFSRGQLDELALCSHQKAATAQSSGYFDKGLVTVHDEDRQVLLAQDDNIRQSLDFAKLSGLPASFSEAAKYLPPAITSQLPGYQALHSAGSSPSLVDGASLVLLVSGEACQQYGLTSRARVRHFSNASDDPVVMLTGHIKSTEKLLKATGLTVSDIDLWEVNESFAASVLNYQRHFSIENDKLNVNGSAIAMGHPLGATGGNLLGMALDELERRDLKRAIISIPGGAGVGVTTLIER